MSKREIFEVISELSDDIIAEAEKSQNKLKLSRVKKIILTAAIISAILGITVFAANIILIGRSSHSSNIPTYNESPSAEILKQDIGISANIKSRYNNGYTFSRGYITENEDVFDNSETKNYKGLECVYAKGNKELCIFIEPQTFASKSAYKKSSVHYKDCEIVYYSYKNKVVPSDYKMTEQDKKDEKTGKYVFSYGSDEVIIADVQIAAWTHNGLSFEILDNSASASIDEIIEMAKETINFQEDTK